MQEVLGGLKYLRQLLSLDNICWMHQIAEIEGYAAVVFGFCESEVVMEFLLLAFLVDFFSFFQFFSVEQCFRRQSNFLGTDLFNQIKQPRRNRRRRERHVFQPDFPRRQEVLGGLKYHRQLSSPEIK